MKLRPALTRACLTAAVALIAPEAFGQAAEGTFPVTVTVQNSVTLTSIQDLAFGTVTAISSNAAGDTAAMTVPITSSAPTATAGASALIIPITGAKRGEYEVSDAPPFTPLDITLPATVPLAGGAGSASFTVDHLAVGLVTGKGSNLTSPLANTYNATTNATGQLGFYVGGTLNTAVSPLPYIEQTYQGDLKITINY